MLLLLLAGTAFAVGQHLFYQSLNNKTPPDASLSVLGRSRTISMQKLNISVGNALAFLAKACLALAVASAHEQLSWKIVKNRPAQVGLIDALFASRDDLISAFNVRVWWNMPFATLLLPVFW